MTRLVARYLLDFNAGYLHTPADRRRTAAYAGLIIFAALIILATSALVPTVDRIMGWDQPTVQASGGADVPGGAGLRARTP